MPTFYFRVSTSRETVVKVTADDEDAAQIQAMHWFLDTGTLPDLNDVDARSVSKQTYDDWAGEGAITVDGSGYTTDDDEEDEEDHLTDEERDRHDALSLAMERNPDLAFTASDMEDH